jgi:hypothetical protein
MQSPHLPTAVRISNPKYVKVLGQPFCRPCHRTSASLSAKWDGCYRLTRLHGSTSPPPRIQYLTYLSLLQEHTASRKHLHRILFSAKAVTSFQVFPTFPVSSTLPLRVLLGLPPLRRPWGLQLRTCVSLACGSLKAAICCIIGLSCHSAEMFVRNCFRPEAFRDSS